MNTNTATTILGIIAIVSEALVQNNVFPQVTGPVAIAAAAIFAFLTNNPSKPAN